MISYFFKISKTIIKFLKNFLALFFKINRSLLNVLHKLFDLIVYWTYFKSIFRTRELWTLFFIRVLCSAAMYRTFSWKEIKRYHEAYNYVNGAIYFKLQTRVRPDLTLEKKKVIIDEFNLKFSNLAIAKINLINEVNKFKTTKINNMGDLINKSNLYKPIKKFLLKRKSILWCLAVINIKIKIIKEKILIKKKEIKEKILKKIKEFKENFFKKIKEFKENFFKKIKRFTEILYNINKINKTEKNTFKKIFLIIKEIFKKNKIKEEIKEDVKMEIKIKTETETEKIWSDYKNNKYLIKEYSYKIAAWNEFGIEHEYLYLDYLHFYLF